MRELWEDELDEDDQSDDEEDENSRDTRLIKIMGDLMVDLDFLEPEDLAKGIDHFVKQEKHEIVRLK